MNIESIHTHLFEAALEKPIADARNVIHRRSALLVEVRTSDGVVGWGEAASFANSGSLATHALQMLAPHYVGRDSRDIARLQRDALHGTQHFGRRGVVVSAISALDCALWDVMGKRAGLPVHRLLGSFRSDIQYYLNAGYYQPDDPSPARTLQESIETSLARNPSGLKIKIGRHGSKDDSARIELASRILDGRRDLMVDANSSLNLRSLTVVDAACVAHGVRWIEEPVPLGPLPFLREVRERSTTPIAGYELEMTLHGYAPLVEGRVVDVVQPDTIWSGGITECLRIASVADAHGIELIPHNFASLLSLASNAHLACAAPTGGWLEVDSNPNPFLWALDRERRWAPGADGRIRIPEMAGLGVDPDLDSLEPYRVS